jgi:uncharacterized protein YjiS (DUF1127 family)
MLTPLDNSCYGISIMQDNDITSAIKNGVSFSSVCQYALDKLKLFLSALRLWKEKRRTRYYLSEMSPHMLKDIGISESERQEELGKKFWQ